MNLVERIDICKELEIDLGSFVTDDLGWIDFGESAASTSQVLFAPAEASLCGRHIHKAHSEQI